MKKKIVILSLILTMIIPNTVYAASNSSSTTNTIVSETNADISPYWMYTYSKTVVNYYSSISNVPEELHYTEYREGYGWCTGILSLQSVVVKGSGYNATFVGTMYAPNQ